MRITFILPALDLSGGLKVVAIYAEKLGRRGHEVLVVVPAARPMSFRQGIRSLISGKGWPRRRDQASHIEGRDIACRLLKHPPPITDQDVPDADIVIATWWETAEWVNALSPAKGRKIYFIQHHEVFPYLPFERCRETYRLPLHKIVISRWLKDVMATDYSDTSTDLILNSVDMTQFFAEPRGKQRVATIGFLYSTTGFKSIGVTFSAIERIRQRLGSIRIIAFGAEFVSRGCPLPEGTEFHYRPPQDSIRNLYSSCDVWLCGSSSEGFHLPPLEAMACRCPVVSTKVGGPVDIIENGKNGYLVDVGDSTALAENAISVLSLSEQAWKAMSDAAHETAILYSWDDATELFEQALIRQVERDQMARSFDRRAV